MFMEIELGGLLWPTRPNEMTYLALGEALQDDARVECVLPVGDGRSVIVLRREGGGAKPLPEVRWLSEDGDPGSDLIGQHLPE